MTNYVGCEPIKIASTRLYSLNIAILESCIILMTAKICKLVSAKHPTHFSLNFTNFFRTLYSSCVTIKFENKKFHFLFGIAAMPFLTSGVWFLPK